MKILNKYIYIILAFVILSSMKVFAKDTITNEYINNVFLVAGIIDDVDNLDSEITRNEFAKMVVMSSPYRDLDGDFERIATEHKYMIRNMYGDFQGNNNTSYNDLIRACITLLSYEDKDFTGNKVTARATKFVELELNKNIDKNVLLPITKQDIINGLYNTLKEKINGSNKKLYEIVFNDMTTNEDGELSVSDMKKTELDGPYLINRGENYNLPFDIEDEKNAYYVNGRKLTYGDIKDDIENYGYAVIYYDKDNHTVYECSERADVALTVACKRGYIDEINYNAKDMVTPHTVDMGLYRYKIESDEMIFGFSHVGHIRKGDKVIIVYNKINDIIRLREELGEEKDEGRIINGSIITAFKVN